MEDIKIEIKNSKIYKNQSFVLSKFNVIYGKNGYGKTTLADLLTSQFDYYDKRDAIPELDQLQNAKGIFRTSATIGSHSEIVYDYPDYDAYLRLDKMDNIIWNPSFGAFYHFRSNAHYTPVTTLEINLVEEDAIINSLKYIKFLEEWKPEVFRLAQEDFSLYDFVNSAFKILKIKISKPQVTKLINRVFNGGYRDRDFKSIEERIVEDRMSLLGDEDLLKGEIQSATKKSIKSYLRYKFAIGIFLSLIGKKDALKEIKDKGLLKYNERAYILPIAFPRRVLFQRFTDPIDKLMALRNLDELEKKELLNESKLKKKRKAAKKDVISKIRESLLGSFSLDDKFTYDKQGVLRFKNDGDRVIELSTSESKVFYFLSMISEIISKDDKDIHILIDDPVDSFDEERAIIWSYYINGLPSIIKKYSNVEKNIRITLLSNRLSFINNIFKGGYSNSNYKYYQLKRGTDRTSIENISYKKRSIPSEHIKNIRRINPSDPVSIKMNSLRVITEYLQLIYSDEQIINVVGQSNYDILTLTSNKGSHGDFFDWIEPSEIPMQKIKDISNKLLEHIDANFKGIK